MSELNRVLYQTIIGDSEFRSLTGATAKDPRVYKTRTPVKLTVNDVMPSYVIYFTAGTSRIPSGEAIEIAQRNDKTYSLEVYGKKDTNVENICARIERLFRDEEFMTASYKICLTYATTGRLGFDDGRQLYLQTMMVFFRKILALNLAS